MPAELTSDHKAYVYTYTRTPDDATRFYIFDEDFQLVKEFTTLPGPREEYTYQIQERERIPIEATMYDEYRRYPVSCDGISEGLSIQVVLAVLIANSGDEWAITMMEDGTQIIVNTRRYYKEDVFGNKYPQMYVRQDSDGLWYLYEASYETEYAPYGEWKEPKLYERSEECENPIRIDIIPLDASEGESYELTRGIFGNDFYYMYPEFKKVEFDNYKTYEDTDWAYYREWGFRIEVKAYNIYDSSNNVIARLEIPEGYHEPYYKNLDFIRLGNKRYLALDLNSDSGSGYFTAIYLIDDNNKVNQIAIAPSTKVSPRTPRQGESVNLQFDDNSTSFDRIIQVVSDSGQVMMRTKLPAGQTSLDINTSNLKQGMYIVTIDTNGRDKEAAKIIVR